MVLVDPADATTVSVSEISPEVKVELEQLGIDVNSAEFQAEFSEAAVLVKMERL